MASENPSSARLSRSASDVSGVNRQRTPGTSSSLVDRAKDTLPRAKVQALEQFVKFGRKGKQKERDKSDQKAAEFPPPLWLDSTPVSTTCASPATANTIPTAARAAPHPRTPHSSASQPSDDASSVDTICDRCDYFIRCCAIRNSRSSHPRRFHASSL